MEPDPQRPELALCVDVLAPEGYGEIIGGSQRIGDYELAAASACTIMICRRRPSSGIWTCASTAACRMRASAWASSGRWPGFAAWSTCAKRFRFARTLTAHLSLGTGGLETDASRREIMTPEYCNCSQCQDEPANRPVVADNIVPKKSGYWACRWIWDSPAAAWTWALRRCEWPALKRVWKQLGHVVEDGGNIAVAIAGTEEGRRSAREVSQRDHRHLHQARGDGPQDPGGGQVPAGAGRRPFRGRRDRGRRGGIFSRSAQEQKIGLIWIDAHADINTPETSPSGNVHGMPLAAIMGLGPPELANIYGFAPKVHPENCVLVGVRDIDAREKENIKRDRH